MRLPGQAEEVQMGPLVSTGRSSPDNPFVGELSPDNPFGPPDDNPFGPVQGPMQAYQITQPGPIQQTFGDPVGDVARGVAAGTAGVLDFLSTPTRLIMEGAASLLGVEGPGTIAGSFGLEGRPQTRTEAAARLGTESILMTLPIIGWYGRGTQVTSALGKSLQEMSRQYLSRPIRSFSFEATAGAGAGIAGFEAARQFPDEPAAEMLAMIGGGLTTAAAIQAGPMLARQAGRGVVAVGEQLPLMAYLISTTRLALPRNAKQRAAARLMRAEPDPARMVGDPDILPGTQLTPAQKADSPGLLALEKAIINESDDLTKQAYRDQLGEITKAIRQSLKESPDTIAGPEDVHEYLRALGDTRLQVAAMRADEALQKIGPKATREDVNRLARLELEKAASDIRRMESDLHNMIPGEDAVSFGNTVDAYNRLLADLPVAQHRDLPPVAKQLLDDRSAKFLGKVEPAQAPTPAPVVAKALQRRGLKGDRLADAIDTAEELAGVGAQILPDGTVVVYHRTTEDAAALIVKEGRMIGKEDSLFFGTSPKGQIEGYGTTVVRVKIPIEKLGIDDLFDAEAHVTLLTKGKPFQAVFEVVREGGETQVKELRGLYSALREDARLARAAGKYNKARIADDIADGITSDLATIPGDPARDAVAFSAAANERLRQGPVGSILGSSRQGGPALAPGLTLETTVGGSGPAAREATDAILEAVSFAQRLPKAAADRQVMEGFIKQYIADDFKRASTRGGKFAPDNAERFLAQNQDVLKRFPELRRDLEAAMVTGGELRMAEQFSNPTINRTAIFLKGDPADAVRKIMRSDDPALIARETMEALAGDSTGRAAAGFRQSIMDHILKSSETRQTVDVTGEAFLSGVKMQQLVNSPRFKAMAREVFSEEEVIRIKQAAETALRVERALLTPAASEGVFGDAPGLITNAISGIMGAAMGRRLGRATGAGGTVQIPGIVATVFRTAQKAGMKEPAKRLIIDAMEDGEFWRLLNAPIETVQPQLTQRLNAWLVGVLVEHGSREPKSETGPIPEDAISTLR